jgi:hypothetical protein
MSEKEALIAIKDLRTIRTKTTTPIISRPTLTVAKTTQDKENLRKYLASYEEAVKETIKGLKKPNLIIEIIMAIVTIILLIASPFLTNISGILTTGSVSGVSLLSVGKSVADALKVYNGDKTKLNVSVIKLKGMLEACSDTDTAGLQKVREAIDAAFKALEDLPR